MTGRFVTIGFITFGKFVTALVQKLKILGVHKNCELRYWLQISLFTLVFEPMML